MKGCSSEMKLNHEIKVLTTFSEGEETKQLGSTETNISLAETWKEAIIKKKPSFVVFVSEPERDSLRREEKSCFQGHGFGPGKID